MAAASSCRAPALAAPLEGALSALSIAMVLLAAGFVAVRS